MMMKVSKIIHENHDSDSDSSTCSSVFRQKLRLCHITYTNDLITTSTRDISSAVSTTVVAAAAATNNNNNNPVRTVSFSVGGDLTGYPVLFIPPLGMNRRMALSIVDDAKTAGIQLICVNRPGIGDTTITTTTTTATATTSPFSHVIDTTCQDMLAVLQALGVIQTKVGILFMCAGTPFALAFCNQYPDHINEDKVIGLAPFVSPADCTETKSLFQFGAHYCPKCLLGPVVSSAFRTVMSCTTAWMSESRHLADMKRHLSEQEYAALEQRFSSKRQQQQQQPQGQDEYSFLKQMQWMMQESSRGMSTEVKIILSPASDVGVPYQQVFQNIQLFHGEDDGLTPIEAAEWLSMQLPCAKLERLQHGTHEGTLFFLHESVVEAFGLLGKVSRESI